MILIEVNACFDCPLTELLCSVRDTNKSGQRIVPERCPLKSETVGVILTQYLQAPEPRDSNQP